MEKFYHSHKYDIPLYHGKLWVIVTDDLEKLTGEVPHYDKDYIFAQTAMWNTGEDQYFVVVLNPNHGIVLDHGVMAHEALHVVSYLADTRSILMDPNNDEPLAYLIGWIVNRLYDTVVEAGCKLEIDGIKGKSN